MFKIFTFTSLGALVFSILSLNKKVDRNSKIVGNLKVSDFDEDFWGE